ncbi:hypothetical protein MHBO_001301 [Bonamia ostreae]|uniref:Choline transporter-like protein n=1 Tax=Bonamia ostreae TaxID=126728 RepID=A0ABV2AIG9_9EUKA
MSPNLNPNLLSKNVSKFKSKFKVGVILLSYIVGIALIFIFKHKPLCSLYCILVVYAASIVASFILIFVFYTRRTSFLILSAIVSLIFIVFVFLAVCRQIELTALYLKLASLIITKHIEIVYLSLFFNSILIIVTILTISSYYYFIRINKARLYVLYLILISFTSIWTYRTVFYLQFTICSEFAASIFLEKMARKKKKLADSATKILSGSLGTISLVTLIITLVEILVAVLKQLFYEVNTYLGCICGAILDFLEAIVKLLSELLLVHVAIDRNNFAKSYKATKKTMKNPNGSIITYVTTKILINACAFSGALIVFFVCKVVFERVGIADNVFYCLIAAMVFICDKSSIFLGL